MQKQKHAAVRLNPERHYAEGNEAEIKGHILYDSTYKMY